MKITSQTELYGIIGFPISHSLSPMIHNYAFQYYEINSVYLAFPVKDLTRRLKKSLIELGIRGFSVTIPHKQKAKELADSQDAVSRCCGASNTIQLQEGKWHSYNTDAVGSLLCLRRKFGSLEGKNVLIIGYGGSASAIANVILLEEKPQSLTILGRNKRRKKKFVRQLQNNHFGRGCQILCGDSKTISPDQIDLIIQTTPLGMSGFSGDELPLPEKFVQKHHCVFDIVYNPQETPLLRHASSQGAEIIYGYWMLLYQACIQFEIFTDQKAPEEGMERKLLEYLNGSKTT